MKATIAANLNAFAPQLGHLLPTHRISAVSDSDTRP
jgi:hypothetical protein